MFSFAELITVFIAMIADMFPKEVRRAQMWFDTIMTNYHIIDEMVNDAKYETIHHYQRKYASSSPRKPEHSTQAAPSSFPRRSSRSNSPKSKRSADSKAETPSTPRSRTSSRSSSSSPASSSSSKFSRYAPIPSSARFTEFSDVEANSSSNSSRSSSRASSPSASPRMARKTFASEQEHRDALKKLESLYSAYKVKKDAFTASC